MELLKARRGSGWPQEKARWLWAWTLRLLVARCRSRRHRWAPVGALAHGYRALGFEDAAGGDEVFEQSALARVIEPTSKLSSV